MIDLLQHTDEMFSGVHHLKIISPGLALGNDILENFQDSRQSAELRYVIEVL